VYDDQGYNQDGYRRDTGLNREGLTRRQEIVRANAEDGAQGDHGDDVDDEEGDEEGDDPEWEVLQHLTPEQRAIINLLPDGAREDALDQHRIELFENEGIMFDQFLPQHQHHGGDEDGGDEDGDEGDGDEGDGEEGDVDEGDVDEGDDDGNDDSDNAEDDNNNNDETPHPQADPTTQTHGEPVVLEELPHDVTNITHPQDLPGAFPPDQDQDTQQDASSTTEAAMEATTSHGQANDDTHVV
jgi:hypothetical protein